MCSGAGGAALFEEPILFQFKSIDFFGAMYDDASEQFDSSRQNVLCNYVFVCVVGLMSQAGAR